MDTVLVVALFLLAYGLGYRSALLRHKKEAEIDAAHVEGLLSRHKKEVDFLRSKPCGVCGWPSANGGKGW